MQIRHKTADAIRGCTKSAATPLKRIQNAVKLWLSKGSLDKKENKTAMIRTGSRGLADGLY